MGRGATLWRLGASIAGVACGRALARPRGRAERSRSGAGSDQPRRGGIFNFSIGGAEIDEATLKKIAEITKAQYFRATDLKSLEETYRQIDEMEKTKIELDQYTRYEEKFAPFLILGLLCLALELLLGTTRLGRLP